MNYEILWGNVQEIVANAGNPYEACIMVMQDHLSNKLPTCFEITTLDSFAKMEIGTDEIIRLMVLANNPDDPDIMDYLVPQPKLVGVQDGFEDGTLSPELSH